MMDTPAILTKELIGGRYSNNLIDITNKLIDVNQHSRLGYFGIKEVKAHPFFKDFKWEKLKNKILKPTFIPHVAFGDLDRRKILSILEYRLRRQSN